MALEIFRSCITRSIRVLQEKLYQYVHKRQLPHIGGDYLSSTSFRMLLIRSIWRQCIKVYRYESFKDVCRTCIDHFWMHIKVGHHWPIKVGIVKMEAGRKSTECAINFLLSSAGIYHPYKRNICPCSNLFDYLLEILFIDELLARFMLAYANTHLQAWPICM